MAIVLGGGGGGGGGGGAIKFWEQDDQACIERMCLCECMNNFEVL